MKSLFVTLPMIAATAFASTAKQTPVFISQPLPAFPFTANKSKLPAQVTVRFIVDEKGATRDIIVTHSTNKDFEKPATAAVTHWRVAPPANPTDAASTRMNAIFVFGADHAVSATVTN